MMATPQKHKCHDMNVSETSVPSCLFFLRAMQDITNDCVFPVLKRLIYIYIITYRPTTPLIKKHHKEQGQCHP